jgi:hypothetical protein
MYLELSIKKIKIIMIGVIVMNKIIKKLTSIIRGSGMPLYEIENKSIKRDCWGNWVSPDKQND